MSFYRKLEKPAWFYDPATNRQLKVLRFFNVDFPPHINKGVASGFITRIFREDENKELWEKYVYLTGDESQESPDLQPFDWTELRAVTIPDDWSPKRASGIPSERQERLRAIIADMLKEGTPFDDPLPQISFPGRNFAFTGKFTSGQRPECQTAVEELGAVGQSGVNRNTDYLVIGNEGSANWAEGSHGRKIEKAMILRMETGRPAILSEADWVEAVQDARENRTR